MVTPHPRVQLALQAADIDAVLSCSPGVTAALGNDEIPAVARLTMDAGSSASEVAAAVVRRETERHPRTRRTRPLWPPSSSRSTMKRRRRRRMAN